MQLTIRLDPRAARLVREFARRERVSMNRAVTRLILLGASPTEPVGRRPIGHALDAYAGGWSEQEHRAFEEATQVFEKVDDESWK